MNQILSHATIVLGSILLASISVPTSSGFVVLSRHFPRRGSSYYADSSSDNADLLSTENEVPKTTTSPAAVLGPPQEESPISHAKNPKDSLSNTHNNCDASGEEMIRPRSRPGHDENDLFPNCDEHVAFWRDFQNTPNGLESTAQNAQSLAAVAAWFTSPQEQQQDLSQSLAYWMRHTGRSAYFATNAILGNVGFALHERLIGASNEGGQRSDDNSNILPINLKGATASRLLLEAALCYQQDFTEIRAGTYRAPWDMVSLLENHRQSSPLNVLTQTNRFVREAIGTFGRRKRNMPEDKQIWISNDATPELYPDYYRNAFHFQTDGWMSKASADVYETSTETLFLGRQDAMQRASLKPLVEWSRKQHSTTSSSSSSSSTTTTSRPMRVLEIACGTGRFMTFVRDNLPLDTEYTAVDLSPYYLDKARDNDKYWRQTRQKKETSTAAGRGGTTRSRSNGSSSSSSRTSTKIAPANMVQAQAEALPFADASFDAVVCVYLFHELPRSVRTLVAREMARVVAPGGTVVLTDSIQLGDRPVLDDSMGGFSNFNEPYYTDYIEDLLPRHFEGTGLRPSSKTVRSSTKSLSFIKEE